MADTKLTYTTTREIDGDGELWGIASLDVDGHISHDAAELFMVTTLAEELSEDEDFVHPLGIEIEHLWRSEHPMSADEYDAEYMGERWTYHYTEQERPGSVPVTRFQIASHWTRPATSPTAPRATRDPKTGEWTEEGVDYYPIVCVKHPDTLAVTGIPIERFTKDSRSQALDGMIYYCRPCSADFDERWLAALAVAREEAKRG